MMTSSPRFQLTGVDTRYFAVSCSESSTRSTSSKFRPVVIGYTMRSLIFLSGPTMNTVRTVWLSAAVRPSALSPAVAGSMPYSFAISSVGSPIIGKFGACPWVSSMSLDQVLCLSTGSTERPMIRAPRRSNSGFSFAM